MECDNPAKRPIFDTRSEFQNMHDLYLLVLPSDFFSFPSIFFENT